MTIVSRKVTGMDFTGMERFSPLNFPGTSFCLPYFQPTGIESNILFSGGQIIPKSRRGYQRE
jgi:hypothetical protein